MNIYTIPGVGLGWKLSERSELLIYTNEYTTSARIVVGDKYNGWRDTVDKVNVSSILEEIFE